MSNLILNEFVKPCHSGGPRLQSYYIIRKSSSGKIMFWDFPKLSEFGNDID